MESILTWADKVTDLFVTVPTTTLPNGTVVPSFGVGQYVCTRGQNEMATVRSEELPWVEITYPEARKACAKAGYALITELQWLAIAHDVVRQNMNWTEGKVGEGRILKGMCDWQVNSAKAGNFVPRGVGENRWLTLSNGSRICDLNGNVHQWVFDNVQGDRNGIVCRRFDADSISLQAPFPSMVKGVGWMPAVGWTDNDWTQRAIVRGGSWRSMDSAGVFTIMDNWPDRRSDHVGFRCTKAP